MINAPVAVETIRDETSRLIMPWRLYWGHASVYLSEPKLERHSTVGRTVYLHYVALGCGGSYQLKVCLDSLQWTLVDVDPSP